MRAFVQPTVKAMRVRKLHPSTSAKLIRQGHERGYVVRARFPRHTCGGALVLTWGKGELLNCTHCFAVIPATTQQLAQAVRAERAFLRCKLRGETTDRFPSPTRTYAPRAPQGDLFAPTLAVKLRRCAVCGSRNAKHPEGGQGARCPRCHAPLIARPLARRRRSK